MGEHSHREGPGDTCADHSQRAHDRRNLQRFSAAAGGEAAALELALKLGSVNSSETIPQNLVRETSPATALVLPQAKANFDPCRTIVRAALDAVPFPASSAEGTLTGAEVAATLEQAHLQLDRAPTSIDQYYSVVYKTSYQKAGMGHYKKLSSFRHLLTN